MMCFPAGWIASLKGFNFAPKSNGRFIYISPNLYSSFSSTTLSTREIVTQNSNMDMPRKMGTGGYKILAMRCADSSRVLVIPRLLTFCRSFHQSSLSFPLSFSLLLVHSSP